MNVYDSEKMVHLLERDDYQLASDMKEADVILLNTCSIREKPEHKIYSILGRLKALKDKNPNLVLGVGGVLLNSREKDCWNSHLTWTWFLVPRG